MTAPLLEVRDLTIGFDIQGARQLAVEGVSFDLGVGDTLALVGESGCGKSVTAQAILRLLDEPPAFVDRGTVRYRDEDLLTARPRRLQQIRGTKIAMLFQNPGAVLNPLQQVGALITEAVQASRPMTKTQRRALAVKLLDAVGIPDAAQRAADYPHQLSGGMQQRVALAAAIAEEPELLIADEPTTALDPTIQAQILDLLCALQTSKTTGILMISHDLGVVAQMADRIAVMYAGQIVEHGPAQAVLHTPRHPYTEGLIASARRDKHDGRLASIGGRVPGLHERGPRCRFTPRCAFAQASCSESSPALRPADESAAPLLPGAVEPTGEHLVRCYFPRPAP